MVQPEIQAAQDAALGPQKLGLRERASSQEAEGGGLRVGGEKRCYSLPRSAVLFPFWFSVSWSVKWSH